MSVVRIPRHIARSIDNQVLRISYSPNFIPNFQQFIHIQYGVNRIEDLSPAQKIELIVNEAVRNLGVINTQGNDIQNLNNDIRNLRRDVNGRQVRIDTLNRNATKN